MQGLAGQRSSCAFWPWNPAAGLPGARRSHASACSRRYRQRSSAAGLMLRAARPSSSGGPPGEAEQSDTNELEHNRRRWLVPEGLPAWQQQQQQQQDQGSTEPSLLSWLQERWALLRAGRQQTDDEAGAGSSVEKQQAPWAPLAAAAELALGRAMYKYFNWRQDTAKDLQLITAVFCALLLAGGGIRHWGVDDEAERGAGLWLDVYQVCQWVFGQEFPRPGEPLAQQVLAVVTAMVGLAAFALVLALVEQVVLEGMEAHVKRGSIVFESEHVLILGWCVSQRDLEVVRKMVQQTCMAYSAAGGTTVVVLTQRSKLEMETFFWRCLPESKRHGTKLVFRQGSALVTNDLKLVGACRAASTVIISDQSRSATEADAQAVRAAILLDELETHCMQCSERHTCSRVRDARDAAASDAGAIFAAGAGAGGMHARNLDAAQHSRHIVVEIRTSNAQPLVKYACNNRVVTLPTSQLNAQRLAAMVKRPVLSVVSQQLFNFEHGHSIFLHHFPQLAGRRFGELAPLFPDGIPLGLVEKTNEQQTQGSDAGSGNSSSADGGSKTGGGGRKHDDDEPSIHLMMAPPKDYVIKQQQLLAIIRPTRFKSGEYAPLASPPSSAAGPAAMHQPLIMLSDGMHATHIASPANNIVPAAGLGRVVLSPDRRAAAFASRAPEDSSSSSSSSSTRHGWRLPSMPFVRQLLPGLGSCSSPGSRVCNAAGAPPVHLRQPVPDNPIAMVPLEYMQVDDNPEVVCVLGWGAKTFMSELIKELDHGVSALPAGSTVVFVNTKSPEETLAQVLQHITLENLTVRHICANPLLRTQLANKLGLLLKEIRCTIVLCDEQWVDPDSNEANGIDSLDEPSVLRLDSMVMVAQLNMRKLRFSASLPDINIICQKVATDGLTRFEDRQRIPLGICTNFNSYTAKLLAQVAADPLMLAPITRLGEGAELTVVKASAHAAPGEVVSFSTLAVRCQDAGEVLLGYYRIPEQGEDPILTPVTNPSRQARSVPFVWHGGGGRFMLIVLRRRLAPRRHHGSSTSLDDMEMATTTQAHWVAGAAASHASASHSSPVPALLSPEPAVAGQQPEPLAQR